MATSVPHPWVPQQGYRIWLGRPAARDAATTVAVIPADPGLDPGESRNPVIKATAHMR